MGFCWVESKIVCVVSNLRTKKVQKYVYVYIHLYLNADAPVYIVLSFEMMDQTHEADCTRFKLQAEIDQRISGWMGCHIRQTDR